MLYRNTSTTPITVMGTDGSTYVLQPGQSGEVLPILGFAKTGGVVRIADPIMVGTVGGVTIHPTTGVSIDNDLSVSGDSDLDSLPFLRKVLNIGDWNMDSTASISVAHGLTASKIRGVTGYIRSDSGLSSYPVSLGSVSPAATDAEVTITQVNSTNVLLSRRSGGVFDMADFDSVSYNRGWLMIDYVA